jgi:protein-disulfide isomerase
MKQYVDSGKIRYTVLDAPLPIHKLAAKAAEASHCAEEQGKFWEMHDQMMANQKALNDLSSYATSLNLDVPRFEECLKTDKYADQVNKDKAVASQLNISGVPGFVLALSDPQKPSKVKGISFIMGAQPFSVFQKEIDQALADLSK